MTLAKTDKGGISLLKIPLLKIRYIRNDYKWKVIKLMKEI